MPRIGVAGTHGHGATHVDAARELEREGRAVLAAVADHRAPGPELAGVPAYHEASEMIASESLDVVVLSTPMHTHLPLAEAALATGAHVLLEKPPTPTLDEFHRLVAASAASGRAVQLGFQSLGSSAVPEMRASSPTARSESPCASARSPRGCAPRRTGAARRGRAGARSTACPSSTAR